MAVTRNQLPPPPLPPRRAEARPPDPGRPRCQVRGCHAEASLLPADLELYVQTSWGETWGLTLDLCLCGIHIDWLAELERDLGAMRPPAGAFELDDSDPEDDSDEDDRA